METKDSKVNNSQRKDNTVKMSKNPLKAKYCLTNFQANEDREQKMIFCEQLFQIQGEKLKTLLHRSIGALTSLNKYKQIVAGTGVIISKNMVLTCAHNVFDKDQGCQNQSIKFYLEDNGKASKYYNVSAIRYPQEYKTCSSANKIPFDFALLKLEKQVQFDQFLQIALPCETCITNDKQMSLKIFGYPLYNRNYQYLDEFGNQFLLSQYGLARSDRIALIDPSQNKMHLNNDLNYKY